jgi:ATP-dependent RNA helicase RhlE
VQRIKQVIHPVGRGKKKQVLLHIIQENNWSQVLVFTRTKFGANNVAEYLTKNGVSAMALHGNKSQSARTQALEGFKTANCARWWQQISRHAASTLTNCPTW